MRKIISSHRPGVRLRLGLRRLVFVLPAVVLLAAAAGVAVAARAPGASAAVVVFAACLGAVAVALALATVLLLRGRHRHVGEAQLDALHDPLTALPTRRLFDDRVAQALAQSSRDGSGAALLLIDLDRFKQVNDSVGHAAGDVLLREVACRLVAAVREVDTVARIGGDEFALVLVGVGEAEAREAAMRIHAELEPPVVAAGAVLTVEASIGIALHPRDGVTGAQLMQHADAAMYSAKHAGVHYAFYDAALRAAAALGTELHAALERDELLLHYQPRLDLATGTVTCVEALLRWQHPIRGLIAAEAFMPTAQRLGLSRRVLDRALVAALRQLSEWRALGIDTPLAVNLDAQNLRSRDLPARIERLIAQYGLDASQIEVELPEAALTADLPAIRAVACELAALGLILVVDDFGTAVGSLSALGALPLERVKLDASLVRAAATSSRERAIASASVDVAHRLGLTVVAEGVEDAALLAFVRRLGVDYAQGYYIGRPVDPRAIEAASPERVVA